MLLPPVPSLQSNGCTWCSEHVSPTAAITQKWHNSFQPSLFAQWWCWIDRAHLAAWSSVTPDKESLTELHLLYAVGCMPLCIRSTSYLACLCSHWLLRCSPISVQTFAFLFSLSDTRVITITSYWRKYFVGLTEGTLSFFAITTSLNSICRKWHYLWNSVSLQVSRALSGETSSY